MKRHWMTMAWLVFLFIFATGCDEKAKKKYTSCDPAELGACGDAGACVAIEGGSHVCLDICDPAAADACGEDLTCLPAKDTFVCYPACDPTDAAACGEGWTCVAYATDAGKCQQECDMEAPACDPPEAVCVPYGDTAVCSAPCDPVNQDACPAGLTCELRTDDLYACYQPVWFDGRVSDASDDEAIEGARVLAADATGAAATSVALSGVDGRYSLQVPVKRNADGTLAEGVFTLRAAAQDYQQFPAGIRPSLPVDATDAVPAADGYHLATALTNITLIPLPVEQQGLASVSGRVVVTTGEVTGGGVLLVLETAANAGEAPFGFSDREGWFTLFNVPDETYVLRGYKADLQLNPLDVVMASAPVVDLEVTQSDTPLSSVSGSVQIVNAPGGSLTTVVLVPESTFSDTFVKGEVPAGLRAPKPPAAPSIAGEFTITGVPDGRYVVLAAFENDGLVRDPDPNIAGTQIVHIVVDGATATEVTLTDSFKVTEALEIIYPGALGPELVDPVGLEFTWVDDSSEDGYHIVVYNAYGDLVWEDDAVPSVSSGDVVVPYAGPELVPGMYYQFRAWSMRNDGAISTTEDLLGVFYTEPLVQ
ncbi:MAG: hypothetical protein CVU59_08875 [Deltaproteobacteria bacterium HGW-Deltaproteobacteria-17]|nr:MAG: hypothetical protein CVU59_08875 [Deltaproteobacteria bacterium HGW-Deltaproteobacteria-17]